MSEQAKRFSKRQIRNQAAQALQKQNARVDKIQGQVVVTPRMILKGHVKWTLAIRRALRPLAEQFGFKVIDSGHGRVICQ